MMILAEFFTPHKMKPSTPSFWQCLGNSSFQSINDAIIEFADIQENIYAEQISSKIFAKIQSSLNIIYDQNSFSITDQNCCLSFKERNCEYHG